MSETLVPDPSLLATSAQAERLDMKRRIRDVLRGPDGALLAIADDPKGDLIRLTPVAAR